MMAIAATVLPSPDSLDFGRVTCDGRLSGLRFGFIKIASIEGGILFDIPPNGWLAVVNQRERYSG
jgi:hypothetical protein